MKSLIVVLVIAISVSSAKATDWLEFTAQISIGQTVAAVVQQTLMASTNVTSYRNYAAKKIQNDIQEYNLTGTMSEFLAERIALVQSVNNQLSEQESIDVLVLATDSILF